MAAFMVTQQFAGLAGVPSQHNLSARKSSFNSTAALGMPKAPTAQSLQMTVVAGKDKKDKKNKKKNSIRTKATAAQADSSAKPVVNFDELGFGLTPTAKMFLATKTVGSDEWTGGLVPYGNLEVSPAAGILNYGQGIFEGMKAYRTAKGRVVVFRPDENAKRMSIGADRMCLEKVPEDLFVKAVMDTVAANVDYIPPLDKGAMYIRPLLIGTGPILGLAPAPECSFMVYVSPVASYFKGGQLTPIDLLVSTKFHRAAPGGAGGTKCVGNYAQVLTTQLSAKAEGYADVMYLDSVYDKYVEEVSSCNVFVVNGKTIRTPPAGETILPGITRKSVIEMARAEGYEVIEELVEVSDLMTADEVFCTGSVEAMAKQPATEVDDVEAKRLRKAAKKAAAAAAEAPEVDEEEAKRQRKAAKKAAVAAAAEEEEVDEEEAKRQRKAAKKAAKEAAASAAAAEEVDEEEAKRERKAAKKAAKAAAAAAVEEAEEAPGKVKKAKREAEDEDAGEDAPKAKKSKTEEATAAPAKGLKLFIKGLPYSVDESTLRNDFEECGKIHILQLPMGEDGRPKGFAFITFATQEGFDAALKFDNTDYQGRYINVSEANGSHQNGGGNDGKGKSKGEGKAKGSAREGDWTCPSCGDNVFARNNACRQCGAERPGGPVAAAGHDHGNTVFIRGIPWGVSEEAMKKDFEDCGEIENFRMPINGEGKPAGIAFIKFKSEAGVEAALKYNDTDYGGRIINVMKSGEGQEKGKGKGKDKGKDGKDKGKGKGKDKGKKGKAPSASFANKTGCIVASTAEVKTFESDDE